MTGEDFLAYMCLIGFAVFAIGTIGLALIEAVKRVDPDIPQTDVPVWDRETLKRDSESEG